MADNSTFDPGTGGDTYRSKDRAGIKTEIVGIDLGIGTGSESLMSGAMPVTDNSGSLTVDNGGTFAVQDSQKIADNAGFTDGTTPVQPAGYIFDEVAGTALTENDTGAARIDSKRAQVLVVEDATTRGQRAAVSAAGAVKVDGSAVTQPVSGTVTANAGSGTLAVSAASLPLPSGASTAAKQPALGTAGAASADVITVQGVASMTAVKVDGSAVTQPVSLAGTQSVNQAQVAGTAVDTNSGTKSAGTQRVVLATDQPALTNALKVDGSAVTQPVSAAVGSPVFTTVTPSTTGGWSKITALAQTTTKKAVKASAGTFGGYYAYNPNATVAYIQVFDVASASVTLGSTAPDLVFAIPATSAANLEITNGVNMATAMTLACTTTATGSTAPGTGLDLTLLFK